MQVSELTLWVDYDRDKLTQLSPEQRIEYFDKRVRLVVINPLTRIVQTEIMVPGSSALLVFGVSLCCAIEAAGKFYTGNTPARGRGANEKRFTAFLHEYMSPQFKQGSAEGLTHGQALWEHFRNGLAHGFTVCHGGFEGAPHEPYFNVRKISNYASLEINPTLFLNDFVSGFEEYVGDLLVADQQDPIRRRFDHVFDLVFVQGK